MVDCLLYFVRGDAFPDQVVIVYLQSSNFIMAIMTMASDKGKMAEKMKLYRKSTATFGPNQHFRKVSTYLTNFMDVFLWALIYKFCKEDKIVYWKYSWWEFTNYHDLNSMCEMQFSLTLTFDTNAEISSTNLKCHSLPLLSMLNCNHLWAWLIWRTIRLTT